jgi:hypothetical protein
MDYFVWKFVSHFKLGSGGLSSFPRKEFKIRYTVNIYRYKAIGANATSSVKYPIGAKELHIGAKGFPDRS